MMSIEMKEFVAAQEHAGVGAPCGEGPLVDAEVGQFVLVGSQEGARGLGLGVGRDALEAEPIRESEALGVIEVRRACHPGRSKAQP